jgi:hypothetical protein
MGGHRGLSGQDRLTFKVVQESGQAQGKPPIFPALFNARTAHVDTEMEAKVSLYMVEVSYVVVMRGMYN